MATVVTPKAELEDGMQEEIEVLIEEHQRLMNAAKEELSRPTISSGSADVWNGKIPALGVAHGSLEKGGETATKGIFVDKSIERMITTTIKTKKRKQSHFSRASNVGGKSFKLTKADPDSSLPPSLSMATTFDTEPCSLSDDEGCDRDGYSTTSGETDHDVPQIKDFSRMSILDIDTILEEQQQNRDWIKQAEIQLEQEEIDQGLLHLHDDSTFGTDMYSSIHTDTREWLEMEVDHAEMISEIALEINKDDGGTYIIPISVKSSNNSVAVASNGISATPTVLPPLVEKKPVVSGMQGVASGDEAEDEMLPMSIPESIPLQEEPLFVETGEEGLPPPPSEEKALGLGSDESVCTMEDEEEYTKIPATPPPPAAFRKSLWFQEEDAVDDDDKESLHPSVGTEHSPLDSKTESLSASTFILFDDQRADLDNRVELEETEEPMEMTDTLGEPVAGPIDTEKVNNCVEEVETGKLVELPEHLDKLVAGSIDSVEVHNPIGAEDKEPVETLEHPEEPVASLVESDEANSQVGPETEASLAFPEHPEKTDAPPSDLEEVHDPIGPEIEVSMAMPDHPEKPDAPPSDLEEVHDPIGPEIEASPTLPDHPEKPDALPSNLEEVHDPIEPEIEVSMAMPDHPEKPDAPPSNLEEVHDPIESETEAPMELRENPEDPIAWPSNLVEMHDQLEPETEAPMELPENPEDPIAWPSNLVEMHDQIEPETEAPMELPENPEDPISWPPNLIEMHDQMELSEHPEELIAGSIDSDEVCEQAPMEVLVALPKDSNPNKGVVVTDRDCVPEALSLIPPDERDPFLSVARDKDGFPETLSLIPPSLPSKVSIAESMASSTVSLSSTTLRSLSTVSTSKSSPAMGERRSRRRSLKRRSSGVHGDFSSRLKHLVVVAMMCVVVGIGIMEHWSTISLQLPRIGNMVLTGLERSQRPEPTLFVDKELPRRRVVEKELPKRPIVDKPLPKRQVIDKPLPKRQMVDKPLPKRQVMDEPLPKGRQNGKKKNPLKSLSRFLARTRSLLSPKRAKVPR